MPAGIVEHERVFHELRDVVRRGISLSASDVVGSLLSSENPVQRILGYAIVSMEPRGEFLEPLVAALELEAETATETKETRPLFQLLCRFGEAFANSAVAPWITQAGVRRALDQVMALLTRRGDLDPGRECRSLLTSLIAQVAAISTGTVSETPWRESTVRSVCDVLKAIALSLHVRGFAVPSPSDLDEQLGRRLRWGTAAVGQLRGDCEWQLPRWIEAAVLPIRHRIGALVPREARVQTDAPLADLLVWVLETLADTCMGVASVEPEFPHYYFFNEEERLEALIRRYPALAKRLSGTVAILESHGGSTDAATLAAAYDTAAEVLRPDAERVAGALEAGIEPPPIDAHALLKFVDAHVMRHLNRPRRDLPVATLRDGSVLDPQRVARVLGEIEPLQFVNPDWVAARERWRELDLAEGSEDEHAFVMLALKRLQAVAQAHVEEFGDHDIALGFEVPVGSASEADEVLRISELGISISIATNGTNEGPQANLSGPIRVFCLTLNRISEYLERLLRPSRSDAPSSVE
jgi:hypothetical protein